MAELILSFNLKMRQREKQSGNDRISAMMDKKDRFCI